MQSTMNDECNSEPEQRVKVVDSDNHDDTTNNQVEATLQVKSDSSSSQKKAKEGQDYSEVSPNKRYIRFNEKYSNTANIKASFRGFDTKNGIEVVWQKIYLSALGEAEQEPIMRSLNYLKEIQQKHIVEYLSIWITEEPRTVNLITTYLDPLEKFVAKVKTLRWRIIKKWCKQLLTGLHYLHSSSPAIVHRNLNLGNIFMNSGLGEIYLGGMWLSAVLAEGSEADNMSDLISTYCYQGRQPGSPAYKAPEILANQPLTPKVDIYSFGMCLLVLLTREDPYVEIYDAYSLEDHEQSNSDTKTTDTVPSGYSNTEEASVTARDDCYAAIASLITKGVLPEAIERVSQCHPEAGVFLRSCLSLNPRDRKSAEELLNDDFLQQPDGEGIDDSVVIKAACSRSSSRRSSKSVLGDVIIEEEVDSTITTVPLPVGDGPRLGDTSSKREPQEENPPMSISDTSVSSSNVPLTQPSTVDSLTKSAVTSSPVVEKMVPVPPVNVEVDDISVSTSICSDNNVKKTKTATLPGDTALKNDMNVVVPVVSTSEPQVSVDMSDKMVPPVEESLSTSAINTLTTFSFSEKSRADVMKQPHVSPTSTEESSLVKELAKLGTSDDVNEDRGIHDGRRSKNASEKDTNVKQGSNPEEKKVESTKVNPIKQIDIQSHNLNTVVIQLQIEGQYTSDGIYKEVEFSFEQGSDRVEMIAAEMKDELHLNLSVEHLVKLIQEKIGQNEGKGNRASTPVTDQLSHQKVDQIKTTSEQPDEVNSISTPLQTPSNETNASDNHTPRTEPSKEEARGLESEVMQTDSGCDNVKGTSAEATNTGLTQNEQSTQPILDVSLKFSRQSPSSSAAAHLNNNFQNTNSTPSSSPIKPSHSERDTTVDVSSNPAVISLTLSKSSSDDVSPTKVDVSSDITSSAAGVNIAESGMARVQETNVTSLNCSSKPLPQRQPISEQQEVDSSVPVLDTSSMNVTEKSISPPPTLSEKGTVPTPSVSTPTATITECTTSTKNINNDSTLSSQTSPASSENRSSSNVPKSSSVVHEVPLPGEEASATELEEYHAFLKEMEAIEKESRAARRVFEQRIQKHKIIQETCEEDLCKMESDFVAQKSKLSGKQQAAEVKREEDLSQLRAELDKNLLELQNAIATRRSQPREMTQAPAEVKMHTLDHSTGNGMNFPMNTVSNETLHPSMTKISSSNNFANFDQTNSSISVTTSSATTTGSVNSCDSPERISTVPSPTSSNAMQHQQQQYNSGLSGHGSNSHSNNSISQMAMDVNINFSQVGSGGNLGNEMHSGIGNNNNNRGSNVQHGSSSSDNDILGGDSVDLSLSSVHNNNSNIHSSSGSGNGKAIPVNLIVKSSLDS